MFRSILKDVYNNIFNIDLFIDFRANLDKRANEIRVEITLLSILNSVGTHFSKSTFTNTITQNTVLVTEVFKNSANLIIGSAKVVLLDIAEN